MTCRPAPASAPAAPAAPPSSSPAPPPPRPPAQPLPRRPDLTVADIRGNVDTRLRKVDKGEYDAVVLAAAGLARLGWLDRATEPLPFDVMLPAAGQGALAVPVRAHDGEAIAIVRAAGDPETAAGGAG